MTSPGWLNIGLPPTRLLSVGVVEQVLGDLAVTGQSLCIEVSLSGSAGSPVGFDPVNQRVHGGGGGHVERVELGEDGHASGRTAARCRADELRRRSSRISVEETAF